MARELNDTRSIAADLAARLESLVAAARAAGREEAFAELRSLLGGAAAPAPRKRGRPARAAKAAKPAKRTKAAKGAKAAKGGAKTRKKSKKPRRNPWASMTPEQKAERVRKMLAGRGIEPKS